MDNNGTIESLSTNKAIITPDNIELEVQNHGLTSKQSTPHVFLFNELFRQSAITHFDRPAASFNNQHINYEQLFSKSNQLAAFLSQKQVSAGDIVAISIDRSIELLTTLIAILKIGATYVPLDPGYPQERLEFMLEDSAAKCIVISSNYKERFKAFVSEIVIDEIWGQLESISDPLPETFLSPHDLAYILYTSGSTGKPKGVKISHGNLSNLLTSMLNKPGISKNDRLLAISTISFDIAGLELFLPLIAGAEVVIAETAATKDSRILLEILKEKQITILQATPATWQMLMDSGWLGTFPLKAFSGGERLTKHLAEHLLTRCTELWNMYGPTETTIYSSIKKVESTDETITIGFPINNTEIYLVDEQGNLSAEDTPGEICIGGEGVGKGYLNRPELTMEKFINDRFSKVPDRILYRTGDLGIYLRGSDLQCLGRIDQQVKIRGHRVELGEIEAILLGARGIKQALITFHEDYQSKQTLIAYVILNTQIINDNSLSWPTQSNTLYSGLKIPKDLATEWKRYCNALLPAIMVPEEFVAMEAFPLTPNGKIDRNALPKPQLKLSTEHSFEAGQLSNNEQIVSEIWSQTLGLENLKKGDDFFELGGNSLLAMKVMVAIEKKSKIRLPLATLFESSTIEKMALQLESNQDTKKWNCIVPIKKSGNKKPLFIVHGGGLNVLVFKSLSEHLDKDRPVYCIQALGLNYYMELPVSVNDIAKRYIDEILLVDPVGPYYIAGYSLGGLFAYEMTKQLLAMGKEVRFTGVIDTSTQTEEDLNVTGDIFTKFKRRLLKIPFFINCLAKHPRLTISHQLKVAIRKLKSIDISEEQKANFGFSNYENVIYDHYRNMLHNYSQLPSEIEVTLFRAEKRKYYLDDNQYLGWRTYAKKGVVRYSVPGDHKTVLSPANAKELAQKIQFAIAAK